LHLRRCQVSASCETANNRQRTLHKTNCVRRGYEVSLYVPLKRSVLNRSQLIPAEVHGLGGICGHPERKKGIAQRGINNTHSFVHYCSGNTRGKCSMFIRRERLNNYVRHYIILERQVAVGRTTCVRRRLCTRSCSNKHTQDQLSLCASCSSDCFSSNARNGARAKGLPVLCVHELCPWGNSSKLGLFTLLSCGMRPSFVRFTPDVERASERLSVHCHSPSRLTRARGPR
jgi:hypothetical protein